MKADKTGRSPWFAAVVVAAAALITFSGTVGFGLVWDDWSLIEQVEKALSDGEITRLFTSSFHVKVEQSARYYRPAMMASLLVDVIAAGGSPWFSHLINVLLHVFNTVLVLMFFRKILDSEAGALAGALLFAVHPVHAETVSVVSSRMDLLALCLLMPAVLHYAAGERTRAPAGLPFRFAILFSYFLACLTKETSFMFPLVLLAQVILLGKKPWKKELLRISPVFLAAAAAFLLRSMVFMGELAGSGSSVLKAGAMLPGVSITRILSILMINMRMVVHPLPDRFHWFSGDVLIQWPTFLAALFFLGFVVWVFRRNADIAVRGIVWWSIFAFPVLGFFNLGHTLASERYAYIPSVGVCLMAGGLAASLPQRLTGRKFLRGLAGGAVLVLMAVSAMHARTWQDEVTLFSKMVETNPSYVDGFVNLGVALAAEGRYEKALEAYGEAEKLAPRETDAVFNRGNLLFSIGKNEEALADFDAVLEKRPDDWEAALNRGNVLAKLGRKEEAVRSYERALRSSRTSGKPLVGLAVLSAREKKYEEAVRFFKEAVSREPTLTEAFEGMGEAYMAMGKYGSAERALLRALDLSPHNTRSAIILGYLLLKTGRPEKAIHAFRTALASDPAFIKAWVGFSIASKAAGLDQEAEKTVREMERKDPALGLKIRHALSEVSP